MTKEILNLTLSLIVLMLCMTPFQFFSVYALLQPLVNLYSTTPYNIEEPCYNSSTTLQNTFLIVQALNGKRQGAFLKAIPNVSCNICQREADNGYIASPVT